MGISCMPLAAGHWQPFGWCNRRTSPRTLEAQGSPEPCRKYMQRFVHVLFLGLTPLVHCQSVASMDIPDVMLACACRAGPLPRGRRPFASPGSAKRIHVFLPNGTGRRTASQMWIWLEWRSVFGHGVTIVLFFPALWHSGK